MTRPIKFSLVTSTFNAAQSLVCTAASLRSQSYRNFEWLIVDGASSDDTVDIARSFGDLVTILISEPDSGIYSAWNKALPLIRGDWVLFLGAGDELYDAETLDKIAAMLADVGPNISIAYGKVVEVEPKTGCEKNVRSDVWHGVNGPWRGGRPKLPPHQGVLHRSDLFSGFRFDTRCMISADNEILLRELLEEHGADIKLIVTRFLLGGISDAKTKRLRMIAESIYINIKVGIFLKRPIYQMIVLALNLVLHVPRLLKLTRH